MNITELLHETINQKASDLHLSSSSVPIIRIDGKLHRLENEPTLTQDAILSMLEEILTSAQFELLKTQFEVDLSVSLKNIARFRLNVFHQLHGISAVFRAIPLKIPSIDELGLPKIVEEFCQLPNGLVLITGPTGQGKSTTLAAMIEYINQTQPKHIVTLEDPIEFVHKNNQCLIQQREIHSHTASFHDALRFVLREDPDIILVGEMRDLETIRLALTAAETGHLVFATLHTSSAAKSVHRIIDAFPAGEKELVCTILSETLQAILSQTLLPKVPSGRVIGHELMICNSAIKNLIRENKIAQIYSVIQTHRKSGMITLEQHLEELIAQGIILPN